MKDIKLTGGLQIVSNEKIVYIKQLNPLAKVPQYQTDQAAGFDFHSVEETMIMPGDTAIISTGLAFEIPEGFEIQVRPRSGLSAKSKIRVSNSPGTLDADYRGEVKIILDNIGTLPFSIKVGDRIAQGVLAPVYKAIFVSSDNLSSTNRSSGGLGSTGV